MILYFSGTGNSEYVAGRIAKQLQQEAVNLFQKIKNRDFSGVYSDHPWVIVTPVYAWRIPRILQEWLEKTALSGSKEIYFVITCGGNIGNAGRSLQKLCHSKQMDYQGSVPIVMPENYIAMFTTPQKEEAMEIIHHAEDQIDQTADWIKSGQMFPHLSLSIKDHLNSSLVNALFYPTCVHAKKFFVKDSCISCGRCAAVCPLNNVGLKNGKPVWGKNCTHCMACICRCPAEAIEYGKHSKGLARYICPKTVE